LITEVSALVLKAETNPIVWMVCAMESVLQKNPFIFRVCRICAILAVIYRILAVLGRFLIWFVLQGSTPF